MEDIRGDYKTYQKKDIAVEYLELAMLEFMRGERFFCALHLAGAAEELLGMLVKISGKQSAFARIKAMFKRYNENRKPHLPAFSDEAVRLSMVGHKNSVKHLDIKKDGETGDDTTVTLDIKKEAQEVIQRAVENFNQLDSPSNTVVMMNYLKHIHRT